MRHRVLAFDVKKTEGACLAYQHEIAWLRQGKPAEEAPRRLSLESTHSAAVINLKATNHMWVVSSPAASHLCDQIAYFVPTHLELRKLRIADVCFRACGAKLHIHMYLFMSATKHHLV